MRPEFDPSGLLPVLMYQVGATAADVVVALPHVIHRVGRELGW